MCFWYSLSTKKAFSILFTSSVNRHNKAGTLNSKNICSRGGLEITHQTVLTLSNGVRQVFWVPQLMWFHLTYTSWTREHFIHSNRDQTVFACRMQIYHWSVHSFSHRAGGVETPSYTLMSFLTTTWPTPHIPALKLKPTKTHKRTHRHGHTWTQIIIMWERCSARCPQRDKDQQEKC